MITGTKEEFSDQLNQLNRYIDETINNVKMDNPVDIHKVYSINTKEDNSKSLMEAIEISKKRGTFESKGYGIYYNSENNFEVLIELIPMGTVMDGITQFKVEIEILVKVSDKLQVLKDFFEKNMNIMMKFPKEKPMEVCYEMQKDTNVPISLKQFSRERWYEAHLKEIFGSGFLKNKSDHPYMISKEPCLFEFTKNLRNVMVSYVGHDFKREDAERLSNRRGSQHFDL